MSPSSIYVVAVSETPLSLGDWDSIRTAIEPRFSTLVGGQSPITHRFLDSADSKQSDHDSSLRVLELTLPRAEGDIPINQERCTALVHQLRASLTTSHPLSLTMQPAPIYNAHREPGLIVFDMDSTLIQQEVIDELARSVGLYDKVAAITEAAMRGEAPYTDFSASLRARVALLKGVKTDIWQKLKEEVITFTPGARELVRVLKSRGWKTAVLSGGFTPLALWVKEELGLDYAEANFLVDEDGVMTGELVAGKAIVDAKRKREMLGVVREKEGIEVERTVAVGDGSNDLLMMHAAGLGIAFNAKPKVQAQAPAVLNAKSLLDVCYLLGLTKEEVDSALR